MSTMTSPSPTSREAFEQMADDIGLTTSEIRHYSEAQHNLIQFPPGEGGRVLVKPSEIEGKGLFALVHFCPGDRICPAAIAEKRTPAGRYTNHSDAPNAKFECEPTGRVTCFAVTHVHAGDEITVDYRQSREAASQAHQILKGES